MRAVVLAGGSGSRLYPTTRATNKHLLAVYSKPLIYHAISTAMRTGARDLLVVTNPPDAPAFTRLLGDGQQWGVSFTYAAQTRPRGIADAFRLAPDFTRDGAVLVLGDNIIDPAPPLDAQAPACCAAVAVADPGRFGVVELDDRGTPLSIEEKPTNPRSSLAVPGLYRFDHRVNDIARSLAPGPRGELEITDVLGVYLAAGELAVTELPPSTTWVDAGTPEALLRAASFVHDREQRTGTLVGSPDLTAWELGLIDDAALERLAGQIAPAPGASPYADALRRVLTA